MNTESNPPTNDVTVPETPLSEDLCVCAECGGRVFRISRHLYEACLFCGSRKRRRNPKRPKICRTCSRTYCRLIPQGRVTCKSRVRLLKPVSKTRLATAGKGLGHICEECQLFPTLSILTECWNGKRDHPCIGKRARSLACKNFVTAIKPAPRREP